MMLFVLLRSLQYAGPGLVISDFDCFYIVARLFADGRIVDAYDLALFTKAQAGLLGGLRSFAWTYPPPFNMVIAPLAWMPRALGFLIFMGLTLSGFLFIVRQLAGQWLAPAYMLLLMPVFNIVAAGQNGFLTGLLASVAMLAMLHNKRWAGVPLGLMIIKPHLAIGLATYVVARRDWRTFWTAAATVVASLLVATLVQGVEIWPAFFNGVRAASGLLPAGYFPFYRMVSSYATVRSLGFGHGAATAVQMVVAVLALAAIIWSGIRLPTRWGLALAGVATMLISPYVFDYDIMVAAAGLALLLPDFVGLARPSVRSVIYGGFVVAAGNGVINEMLGPTRALPPSEHPFALAGVVMIGVFVLLGHALWRGLANQQNGKTSEAQ
jgi:hypothetical protein